MIVDMHYFFRNLFFAR